MKDGVITWMFMLLFAATSIAWYLERNKSQAALYDAGTYETYWRAAQVKIDSLQAQDKVIINNINKVNHYHDERQHIIAAIADSLLADSIRAALYRAANPGRGPADTLATK